MSIRAFGAGKRRTAASARGDRDAERVLALLGERELTASALRDHGIAAPAQAIYELQLVGYTIDRVSIRHANGQTSRYQLRGTAEETEAGRPFPEGGTR